ncbi:MAG: hypothetical protein PUE61_08720 [Clostridiales bacterium]|nr:hypothetical protein [Clostridiales bacterium]
MKLILDCSAIDVILEAWNNGSNSFTQLYCHSAFQLLLKHAQDFQQKAISPEEYIQSLVCIDNIDMRQHLTEIVRNLNYVREVDLNKICNDTAVFLPRHASKNIGNVHVVPFIGIGGLAIEDCVFIDPSPCPWFPDDGSNRQNYIEKYIYPTLCHELHHIGYSHIRISPPISEINTLCELAMDFALQIQMEGGAMLCQKKQNNGTSTTSKMSQVLHSLTWCKNVIDRWDEATNQPIDNEDWETYFSLWENDKPVYWLGEMLCSLLIQHSKAKSVGECMLLNPISMIDMAYSIVDTQVS